MYQRGAAHLGLGKYREGVKEFAQVCKIYPGNRQAKLKYRECKKAATEEAFAKPIER